MATVTEASNVLESGDRLTREEFHRRYCARPDIKKAELVLGVVYVGSPVNSERHAEPHSLIGAWLAVFGAITPGLRVGDNGTVILGLDTEVQPDVYAYWHRPRPGLGFLGPDGYIEGPPVLVVEVAASSASYDLHDKLEAYRRAGVPEYIVWRVLDRRVMWFRLRDGEYVLLQPDEHGIIESEVLPGLRLDVAALLAGDAPRLLAALGVKL